MRIAVLYTELADYTIACLKTLKENERSVELLVIHYPVAKEAPFRFEFEGIGEFICIDKFKSYKDLCTKVDSFRPNKILCSGWINKWYLRLCMHQRKRCVNILAMDTQWTGNLRQRVLSFIAPMTLARIFHKVWIPGSPQAKLAASLGFKKENTLTGFYSCDWDFFDGIYKKRALALEHSVPRSLVCVARYIPEKGLEAMWDAFSRWTESGNNNDWKLVCAGTGAEFAKRRVHPSIQHLGFVQKSEFENLMMDSSVFILPSTFEPWGVVVHEFASAGFPMILSNTVGASAQFLSSENGYSIDVNDASQFITAFESVAALNASQLKAMSKKSNSLAALITPQTWARKLVGA